MVMARKKISKIPEAVTARDRYFGVILEGMQGKRSLLLEGYSALNARIDKLEERMKNLETKFEAFRAEANAKFDILFEGQKRLFDGQQEFFEQMRRFNSRITILEGNS